MREALVGFLFSTLLSMVDKFDGEVKAWVARETGIVHVRNDEYTDDERPLPADVEDDERYVPVTDIKQLDLGKRLCSASPKRTCPATSTRSRHPSARKAHIRASRTWSPSVARTMAGTVSATQRPGRRCNAGTRSTVCNRRIDESKRAR